MSKALFFAIAFLILFAVTIAIPPLPPGETISSYFGIPAPTSILGTSGATIVNGVINGAVWGTILTILYALATRHPKRKPLPRLIPEDYPITTAPPPNPATTSITMSKEPQERKPYTAPRIAPKRRTQIALDQDIETIEGIGPIYGNKLRNQGVNVVGDLLRNGSTRNRRRLLAYQIDVAPATLLKWVYRADFFRIRGIGTQYSALLESAGVNTVPNLSRRNPKNLHETLQAINRRKHLVRRIPPYRTIQRWIKSAQTLKHIIED